MKIAIKNADSYRKEKRGYLASSRIRGHWLAKYWKKCDDFFYPEEFNMTNEEFFNPENQFRILEKYDVVIFNKTYEWKLAKMLTDNGIKVIVDMCDPNHLPTEPDGRSEKNCLLTFMFCSVIVVNTQALADSVRSYTDKPVYIIPDRLDLEWHKPKKEKYREDLNHLVWYGYAENYPNIEAYLPEILKKYEITLISNKPPEMILIGDVRNKITYKTWHPETVCEQIVNTDCVFIAKNENEYKSNNRTITGWALKMPVAYDLDDLKKLKSREARIKNANEGYILTKEKFDIKLSVEEYKKIIDIL